MTRLYMECAACKVVGNGASSGFTRDIDQENIDDNQCCLRRLLHVQPDISAAYGTNAVKQMMKDRGHVYLFLPKAHPELNFIELFWAQCKRLVREQNTGMSKWTIVRIRALFVSIFISFLLHHRGVEIVQGPRSPHS